LASKAIVDYLEKHREEHVAKIQELVRQPSVSTEGVGIAEYAALLRDHYAGIGCKEAHVVDMGDGLPGVWAYFDAGAPHTIGCYSYFDTYGVDESRWEHPPFGGTRLAYDGFPDVVMGRGATVKGAHRTWLNALEAIAAVEGTLPVNVLFMSEGCEEARTSMRSARRRRSISARSRRSSRRAMARASAVRTSRSSSATRTW
jgi:acetylornithine deacetylase/succinyl-diaminopimelate desuccinylase-like protein